MKRFLIIIFALTMTFFSFAQTMDDFNKFKVGFFTEAVYNVSSSGAMEKIIGANYVLDSNNPLMWIFKHKTKPNDSFMFKIMNENTSTYVWSEEEQKLSDYRLLYNNKIIELGFKKVKDETNELVYVYCDKNLVLTVNYSSFTGKVACGLVMCPDQFMIKINCK